MSEFVELRKGMQFRKGSAEKMTLKKWLSQYENTDSISEGDAEKAFYLCGGKKPKTTKKED